MKLFGLIGDPVEHSVSPKMHKAALDELGVDGEYIKKRVGSRELFRVVRGACDFGFDGLNVTLPHKREVLDLCCDLGRDAEVAGAVNTLSFSEKGVFGYNTDVFGARKPVSERVCIDEADVAVAGAGGAARAVCAALSDAKEVVVFNRTLENAEELKRELGEKGVDVGVCSLGVLEDELGGFDLFVNATSVGLDSFGESILSKEALFGDLVVFDLVYRPLWTKLLRNAREVGCEVIRGHEMLVHQGVRALEHWLDTGLGENVVESMEEAVLEELGDLRDGV